MSKLDANSGRTQADFDALPRCEACDRAGAVNADSRLCWDCNRLLVVVRRAIAESVGDRGKLTYPKPEASRG